ncbi:MAG TPA: hypothetical protein VM684_16380, partial [Gaiellales bacterium]|nr:hypothetical protein [Gaiellales bacterium]
MTADQDTADQVTALQETADQLTALQETADHFELLQVTALQVTADQVTAVQAEPDHIDASCACQPGTPAHALWFQAVALNPLSPVAAAVACGMTLCVIDKVPAPARLSRSGVASARTAAFTCAGVARGCLDRYAATTPLVTAVASLVPEPLNMPCGA